MDPGPALTSGRAAPFRGRGAPFRGRTVARRDGADSESEAGQSSSGAAVLSQRGSAAWTPEALRAARGGRLALHAPTMPRGRRTKISVANPCFRRAHLRAWRTRAGAGRRARAPACKRTPAWGAGGPVSRRIAYAPRRRAPRLRGADGGLRGAPLLLLSLPQSSPPSQLRSPMYIFVVILGRQTLVLEVKPHFTVGMVKDTIKHKTGIAPDLYFLTCESRQLDDQRSLRDYDIGNEATLRSTCRMRGGAPAQPKAIAPSEVPPDQSPEETLAASDKNLKKAFHLSCAKGLHIDKLWRRAEGCTVLHELAATLIYTICQ
ncbi:hypothetical protein T492DRAFT_891482, partial [Pavlovales sp. CCMP2436]